MKLRKTLLCAGLAFAAVDAVAAGSTYIYVANVNKSVHAFAVDDTTGALTPVPGGLSTADGSPSTVTSTPDGRNVYTVSPATNDVSGFRANPLTGTLAAIAGSPFPFPSPQSRPIGMAVHPGGRLAYVSAAFGELWKYGIDRVTGALIASGNPARVGISASLGIDPTGRFLYAANTSLTRPLPFPGVTGDISAFTIDPATGALAEIPGSPFPSVGGPQRLTMEPSGRNLLISNTQSRDIRAYAIDKVSGRLSRVGAAVDTGGGNFDIRFEPGGRFVYVTFGERQRISVYAFEPLTFTGISLRKVQDVSTNGASTFLGIDAGGKFLFVTLLGRASAIATYSIDAQTGLLRLATAPVVVDTDTGVIGMAVTRPQVFAITPN